MNVQHLLQEKLRACLTELYPALTADPAQLAEYVGLVRPAQSARFGDYQVNCAMPLGKVLGKQPRAVAQEIVARLDRGEILDEPEVAGPGFINLRLNTAWLAGQLQAMARDARLGVEATAEPKTFVIDYSSPNVAKPMHVGHLRSTIIGDALARLLRFLGHRVIADNHLGDWGTQFGMILWGWKNWRNEEAYAADPVAELARLYRQVSGRITCRGNLRRLQQLRSRGQQAEADALIAEHFPGQPFTEGEIGDLLRQDEGLEEATREETARLHADEPENRALWNQFMPHCLAAIQQVYDRLDIHFDEQLGESAYDSMLAGVVADLEARGLAVPSEGATVVYVEGMEVPFMVRKSDGAFNYATTDLATIKYRAEHFHPDVLLYVVDHRQGGHFRALFDVARRWGYDNLVMEHVGFGTVQGKDRRPYRTRDGDVVGLESLLDEAVARARKVVEENSPELQGKERDRVAEVVGIGAVKYADLCQHRMSDYVYDPDKMMAMDGNTATYMQYAYARNRNIFAKGEVDAAPMRTDPPLPGLAAPEERALALQLMRFSEALASALVEYRPSQITAYLWDLAKTYSGFYNNCPVLKAETPEVRAGRLLLCDLTARVIQKSLSLLGIQTVERM